MLDAQMREKLSDGMKAAIKSGADDDDDGRCILASKLHTILSLGSTEMIEGGRFPLFRHPCCRAECHQLLITVLRYFANRTGELCVCKLIASTYMRTNGRNLT